MKIVTGKIGLILRLGMTAIVLLLGQQAMAVGTDVGTPINNTVDVDYEVNSVPQTTLMSSVSFVVDRRVDFTWTLLGPGLVPVIPGNPIAYSFDLLLTNTSNSTLDFDLALDQAGVTTVRTVADTADMTTPEYAVSAASVLGGDPIPLVGGPQYVDELVEDDSIRIRVWGDAALSMLNGQVAGIQMDAIAHEADDIGGGSLGPILVDGVLNGDLTIENVFANGGAVGGVEDVTDGFIVVTADLAMTKIYDVIAGDLGSGLPIPGATVEYTVTVINSSSTPADDVVITDTIDPNVDLILNAYGGLNDISVVNDGATLPCDVEDNLDGDGCDGPGPALTIGSPDLVGGITVAGLTTLVIQYRVTIPTP